MAPSSVLRMAEHTFTSRSTGVCVPKLCEFFNQPLYSCSRSNLDWVGRAVRPSHELEFLDQRHS